MTQDSLSAPLRDHPHTGEPLSVVGVCLDEETLRFLNLFTASTALIRLRSNTRAYQSTQDPEAILEEFGQPAPDICLIDFDKDRRAATLMAERIHAGLTDTALFAVSAQSQPDTILEAMRCGCSEYLIKPIDREQLVNAVVRIAGRRKEKRDQERGQVLAFIGAKGGCGVTTLATQLGALLASSFSRRVLLIDFHPDFGDAALYLRMTKPNYHFFELLENTDRLDNDFLPSFLMRHSSGLELIPAPEGSFATHDAIPAGALTTALDFLRLRYEFLLVDLPPALNEDNMTVIRDCDQLYLVAVAEVSAVRNVVRQLEYFSRRDIPREKIRVVLNRHHKRNVVTDAQIEKVVEQKIFWRVPNQYPEVVKTIHEGDPVAQLANSAVTRSLEEWAETIGRKPGADGKKKEGGGLFGLWNR